MPCWKGNWQILSALGYGGTNLNQSFKNEPCIQYKIKYKPQSYIVFDHSGNLPCSKFECQCENLLGKSSLGSGGAIWNADTAHQSSDLNFKSRYKETLKTETKNKGEREWGGVKWNTLCNFFYRFSPRTGEEQIQKMLGSLIVTETTSYSTLKRFWLSRHLLKNKCSQTCIFKKVSRLCSDSFMIQKIDNPTRGRANRDSLLIHKTIIRDPTLTG